MKHQKLIAALATAGSLFAVGSAHAFAPLVAAGIASIVGAGVGTAHNQADRDRQAQEAAQANQAPAFAVVPGNATVVMGGPPAVVQENIPAPRDGYRWQQGHFEMRNGTSAWVAGHWVAQ